MMASMNLVNCIAGATVAHLQRQRIHQRLAGHALGRVRGKRNGSLAYTMHEGTDFYDHARKFGDVRA